MYCGTNVATTYYLSAADSVVNCEFVSGIMIRQRTVAKKIELSGIGLHTGKRVCLRILPADPGMGINFVRTDIASNKMIPARARHVTSTTRATSIGDADVRVVTVEHLMAAFFAMNVDNAVCHVNAEEIPVFDGSSANFVEAIRKAGTREQKLGRKFLQVKQTVEVREGDKLARISPDNRFTLKYSIDFDHPAIGKQEFVYDASTDFSKEIAMCRTFGFLADVERMQAMGLALGGSLQNTVVLDTDKVLNPKGLRFDDEFVRHKVLDALGDFALAGHPLIGRVELHKAGHDLQTRLIRKLLDQPGAFMLVDAPGADAADSLALGESAFA